jgi:hypothetical protein
MDFVDDLLPDVVLWTIMLDCWLSVISSWTIVYMKGLAWQLQG